MEEVDRKELIKKITNKHFSKRHTTESDEKWVENHLLEYMEKLKVELEIEAEQQA